MCWLRDGPETTAGRSVVLSGTFEADDHEPYAGCQCPSPVHTEDVSWDTQNSSQILHHSGHFRFTRDMRSVP